LILDLVDKALQETRQVGAEQDLAYEESLSADREKVDTFYQSYIVDQIKCICAGGGSIFMVLHTSHRNFHLKIV